MHDKLHAYQRNGVQEYLVWQMYDRQFDWFHLVESTYQPLLPDENGIIRSQVFPGLQLDVESLLTGDMAEVLAVLQQSIQTQEHATFIQRLNA